MTNRKSFSKSVFKVCQKLSDAAISPMISHDFIFNPFFEPLDKFTTINSLTLINRTSHFARMENVFFRLKTTSNLHLWFESILMLKNCFLILLAHKQRGKIYWNFMQIFHSFVDRTWTCARRKFSWKLLSCFCSDNGKLLWKVWKMYCT